MKNLRHSYLFFFLFLAVCANLLLLILIDAKLFADNCFPYKTAFENFRDGAVTEELVLSFADIPSVGNATSATPETNDHRFCADNTACIKDVKTFSDYLTLYFASSGNATDCGKLEKKLAVIKKYQPEKFQQLQSKIEAMWGDAIVFPVGSITNHPDADVSFSNSWKEGRTFGGERFHEGCDIMPSINERGIYPVRSVSDGVVEKIGWLRLGGYRIGIRSTRGAYFYYAHLSGYAEDFQIGDEVTAGTLLGFMGDTGYSDREGTTGNFPVHLHFGIYFNDENGEEFSVNPFPLLSYLKNKNR